jgi:predicted patatin/cPLA2 family phospholipase
LLRKYCWLTLPWRSAIYDSRGLRNIIRRNYTVELHEILSIAQVRVRVCTVSLNTGKTCYWSPEDVDRETFLRVLSASSNQPGLMAPRQIKKGEDYHVDGGVREIAPITEAIKCGAKKIYAIILEQDAPSLIPDKFNRIPKILLRTLDLMFLETRKNDVALARQVPGVELVVIQPKVQLTDDSLEFVPEKMREMMKLGYQRTKEIVS